MNLFQFFWNRRLIRILLPLRDSRLFCNHLLVSRRCGADQKNQLESSILYRGDGESAVFSLAPNKHRVLTIAPVLTGCLKRRIQECANKTRQRCQAGTEEYR